MWYLQEIRWSFNPIASACEQGVELTLHWRHNERDGVSKHRRLDWLLNRLFRRRSKKTSKLRVTGLWEGNSWPVNSSYKGPVTRKMLPFDDVIMTRNRRSWSTNVRIPLAPTTKSRIRVRVTLSFDLLTGKWPSPHGLYLCHKWI